MGHVPVATFKPRAGECHVHTLRILTDVSRPSLLKLEDVSRLNTLGGLGHFLSVSKTLLVAIRVLALVGATIVANWLFRIRRGTRPSRPPTLLTVLAQKQLAMDHDSGLQKAYGSL